MRNMTLYIVIFVVAFLLLGLILTSKESKRVAKKASALLKKADQKYETFIEDRINLSILKNNEVEFDKEKVINDTMIIIKPYIEGLIANVNSTKNKDISIKYESVFFSSITAYLDALYVKSDQNKTKRLTDQDEKEFYDTFRDAVTADVTQRFVNLKTRAI